MITDIILKLANISEELADKNLLNESSMVQDLMESTVELAKNAGPLMGSDSDPELVAELTGKPVASATSGVNVKTVSGAPIKFLSRKAIENGVGARSIKMDSVIEGINEALKAKGLGKSVEYFSMKPYSEQYDLLLDVASHYNMLTD